MTEQKRRNVSRSKVHAAAKPQAKRKAKARRKRTGWKRFLKIVLFLFLFFGTISMIIWKGFTVEKVVVSGNKLYQDKQIEKWILNDKYSTNSLYVYLKYCFQDTKEIPFIDTMEVTLESPHTVHIKVYEKGTLGYLYMDSLGKNIYFDKDGFVVEMSGKVIDNVPQIQGLECDKVVLYEKLNLKQKGVLKKLLSLTNMLKKFELQPDDITYETGEFILHFQEGTVKIGDHSHLEDKVARLQTILPQIEGKKGVLHLEKWSDLNTDVVFQSTE